MIKRVTVDFDEKSYYLDGEFWKSWDNFGEEMADAINIEFDKLSQENEQLKSFVEYEKREHKHWKKQCLTNIKEIAQLKREIVALKGDVE